MERGAWSVEPGRAVPEACSGLFHGGAELSTLPAMIVLHRSLAFALLLASLLAAGLLQGGCSGDSTSSESSGGTETATSMSTQATTGTAGTGTTGITGTTVSASDSTATESNTDSDSETSTETGGVGIDYDAKGPHPVANDRFVLTVGDRELLVEVWYPAVASAAEEAAEGHPIEDFVPLGPDRDTFEALLADLSTAGELGTRKQTSSAFGAPAAAGPWPVLVFSHCHECVRFSAFSMAEHLASHGFIVAAPDHQGNTLFDPGALLSDSFLMTRVGDLSAALDALLGDAAELPSTLKGLSDPLKIGAFGHSYGAATVGRLAQEDPRILAAMPIAAPIENPIFSGTHVADIHRPLFFVHADEDNSIQALGNTLIELNFKAANTPSWLLKVHDAGHWNFTDICGLSDDFAAGCGDGLRQTMPGEPFSYLDIDVARRLAGAYALAFFDLHIRENPDAAAYLATPEPAEWVEISVRE